MGEVGRRELLLRVTARDALDRSSGLSVFRKGTKAMAQCPPDSAARLHGRARRRLLRGAAAAAAVAAAGALLPPNLRRVLAWGSPRTASLRDIRHVVILTQENRSFDHYFGTLAGVRGFGDPDALRLPDGRPVFYQPDAQNPDRYLLPFHLDTRTSSAQEIPSTSHAWSVQHEAWNGGRMDRWLAAHRGADGARAPYVMGYYE